MELCPQCRCSLGDPMALGGWGDLGVAQGMRGTAGSSVGVRSLCGARDGTCVGRGWSILLTAMSRVPTAESQDSGSRGEADGHLQVHGLPQGALRRERQGQGQERAGEHRGHQRLRQRLQERGHLRRQSQKVGTGARAATAPVPARRPWGRCTALGRARVRWGPGGCAGPAPGCRGVGRPALGGLGESPGRVFCPSAASVPPCAVIPAPLRPPCCHPQPHTVLTALLLRAPPPRRHPHLPYLSPGFRGTLPCPTGDRSLSSPPGDPP